jgi:cell division septum initiation protein DivIVA
MELTPELFEKTEFTERRKGYDIEQVETFLEQTGTALAQLLARTRHTEERAAHAEARLAQADAAIAEAQSRSQSAEQRAEAAERAAREASQGAAAAVAATARQNEEAEVEQAAKTLLMAKRTAEATVNEARGQAQALLEDSQNRAQRQLNEANAEAAELIRRANEQAEAEFADRRSALLDEVRGLEGRRAQLADVITQLESRMAGYLEELGRTAQEIVITRGSVPPRRTSPTCRWLPTRCCRRTRPSGRCCRRPGPSDIDARPHVGPEPEVDLAEDPVVASAVEVDDAGSDGSGAAGVLGQRRRRWRCHRGGHRSAARHRPRRALRRPDDAGDGQHRRGRGRPLGAGQLVPGRGRPGRGRRGRRGPVRTHRPADGVRGAGRGAA